MKAEEKSPAENLSAADIAPYVRAPHYYETDQMAIVHHSNYIRWFEEARVDFMRQVGFGYEKAVEHGVDFAVLSVACQYKAMVRFGETVSITAQISHITPSRMEIAYRVEDKGTGELRATGSSTHCYFDGALQRPISLKKRLPQLYSLFCALCTEESAGG